MRHSNVSTSAKPAPLGAALKTTAFAALLAGTGIIAVAGTSAASEGATATSPAKAAPATIVIEHGPTVTVPAKYEPTHSLPKAPEPVTTTPIVKVPLPVDPTGHPSCPS